MTSEHGGRSDPPTGEGAPNEAAFALCRRRLEQAVGSSCRPDRPWPERVAAGITAALRFADSDPAAARVLTIDTAFRRIRSGSAFEEMVDGFAEMLNRGAPTTAHPDRTARNTVLRIARQTLLQIERLPDVAAVEIAPDLILFALIPYLDFEQAQRWAEQRPEVADGT